MKKNWSVLFLTLLFASGPLWAAEDHSQVIGEHLEQAVIYEEKAARQDVLIADQMQKMRDYKSRYRVEEKRQPTGRIEAMEKHCESIMESAEHLKKSFLEFAKWHRKQAEKLQKQ